MLPWMISALFAGLLAISVTIAIERLGGAKGGLLGTLPSTIIPAAIGLSVASPTLAAFQDALFMTPAGMLINAVFLLLWRIIPPRLPSASPGLRLAMCLCVSLIAWLAMAAGVIKLTQWALVLGVTSSTMALWGIGAGLVVGMAGARNSPPAPPVNKTVGLGIILARGLVASGSIGAAVWLGANAGPMVAGMAAVFPAIFVTTMCALWWSHGESVGAGAVGPMMLGGTSVSVFAWLAAWWIPSLGPGVGCLCAWLVAVGTITLPAWGWLHTKA